MVEELSSKDFDVEAKNLLALKMLQSLADGVVVAWGNSARRSRALAEALPLFDKAHCLGITGRGQPRHPLYVPRAVERVLWRKDSVGDA